MNRRFGAATMLPVGALLAGLIVLGVSSTAFAGSRPQRMPRTVISSTRFTGPLTTTANTPPLAPAITNVSPNVVTSGGGTTVTITGSGFTSASEVDFGSNASSSFSVVSSTTILATAPVGAGVVAVHVMTPVGTSPAVKYDKLSYQPTGQAPITTSGTKLEINGAATTFTGVNAYQLATHWGTNAGCGGMASPAQINTFFSSLAPNSIVRFWAFQGTLGTNVQTHALDWSALDQIFYLAAQNHVYLIPVITDQGGTCDGGHWQDSSWYAGGYKKVFNTAANSDGTGADQLSYGTYLKDIVSRYANSPALGMWEPISEPEASDCPVVDQPSNCAANRTCTESVAEPALLSFFNAVGGQIHTLDPVHPVEAGLLGGGQCGSSGSDYQSVGASSGINVLSVHDYYGSVPIGGDQWNGMQLRFNQAAALNKPIITGEAGIVAGDQAGCESLTQRASDMATKISSQFAAGTSAFLVWDWQTDPLGPCSYNTGPSDTLMNALNKFA